MRSNIKEILEMGKKKIEVLEGQTEIKLGEDKLLDQEQYFKEILEPLADYRYIETDESANIALSTLKNVKEIGVDTETTGLDPHIAKIRLIQISSEYAPTYIFDVFKVDINLLKPLLESTEVVKIFQNAKFDIKMLLSYGIIIRNPIYDTMLANQLLVIGTREHGESNLKALCKAWLDIDISKEEQISDWCATELTEDQLKYAAIDAKVLLKLKGKIDKDLTFYGLTRVSDIEFSAVLPIAMIEHNGMKINIEKWHEMLSTASIEKVELEQKIQAQLKSKGTLFDLEVNLNSPAQLKQRLHDHKIPVTSTDAAVLKKFKEYNPELIGDLLKYKKLNTLLTKFGDKLLDKIHPKTQRLHPYIKQCGTKTGRVSCGDPNLQQIPHSKEVRSLFIAEKGNKLVIADFSQMELRIAAEYTHCKNMLQAYQEGKDLHKLTASYILDKPLDTITKEERKIAKSAAFGLIYGSSVQGFINYSESNYGIKLKEKEAKRIMKKFFSRYPELQRWHGETQIKLEETKLDCKHVTTFTGRLRYIPNPTKQKVLNTPIQGTGGDITKLSLAYLTSNTNLDYLLLHLNAAIIAVVHDEIVLEVPEDKTKDAAKFLTQQMCSAADDILTLVPSEAESNIGDSWADK